MHAVSLFLSHVFLFHNAFFLKLPELRAGKPRKSKVHLTRFARIDFYCGMLGEL